MEEIERWRRDQLRALGKRAGTVFNTCEHHLDPDNESHWDSEGNPSVEAVRQISGVHDLTKEEMEEISRRVVAIESEAWRMEEATYEAKRQAYVATNSPLIQAWRAASQEERNRFFDAAIEGALNDLPPYPPPAVA